MASKPRKTRTRGNNQGTLYKRRPGGPWVASWRTHDKRRRTKSTGTTDKAAAERILAKYVAGEALRREGVIDTRLEAHATEARRPIGEQIDAFESALSAKGGTARHVELLTNRVRRVIEGCKFKTWADVSASTVSDFLRGLRQDKVTKNEAGEETDRKAGISAQTFNYYLSSMKQFARWMVKDRRASDNPLAHLDGLNVKANKRRQRRALTGDELRKLIDMTEHGPVVKVKGKPKRVPIDRFGMTAAARAMLYRLAVETGLRAGEIRSLTRASFALDAKSPAVTVQAAYSKRRRDDTLPLRSTTAEALAAR